MTFSVYFAAIKSNQREVHWTCYISNTIWQKVQNSIPQPHQLFLLDPWKIVKDVFFRKNGTFVKSWSKTTVIISHLESLLSSSRDLSVRRSYFSNRYPGQVFVKVRGAQKQMHTSCCTDRWYCFLLQRSHCHINWFCGDMKYHFDIWLCIFQVQPIWDIFLPSIDYYKTIWVIFLLYALTIAYNLPHCITIAYVAQPRLVKWTRPSILCVTHQMSRKKRNYSVGWTVPIEMMN